MMHSIETKKNTFNSLDVFVSVLALVLVLAGLLHGFAMVLAFILCALYVLWVDEIKSKTFLIFLMPFANIFKLSPEGLSLFSLLSVVLITKYLFTDRRIGLLYYLLFAVFLVFQVLGCFGNYSLLVKQMSLMPFICFFVGGKNNSAYYTLALLMGCITSGILGLLRDFIPNLGLYVGTLKAWDVAAAYSNANRFCGLYTDPNYFSLILVLATICLLVSINNKIVSKKWDICLIPIVYLGMLTLSKSFYLMLIILMSYMQYFAVKNKQYLRLIFLVVISMTAVVYFFNTSNTSIAAFRSRLLGGNEISSGRFDSWNTYLGIIVSNPVNFIFGYGIGAPMHGAAPHSTPIDFLYYYGMLGSLVFIFFLIKLYRDHRTRYPKREKSVNFAPAVCCIVSMCFLSCLMAYDFAYLLSIILVFAI